MNKINCNLWKYIFKKDQHFEHNDELLILFKSFENKDSLPTKLMIPTTKFVNFITTNIYKKSIEKNP